MLYNKAIRLPIVAQFSRPRPRGLFHSSAGFIGQAADWQESFRVLRIKKASTLAGSMAVFKHHMCLLFSPFSQGSLYEASAFRTQRQTQMLECSDSPHVHCTHSATTLCQTFSQSSPNPYKSTEMQGWIIPPLRVGTELWVHTVRKWQDGGWRCKTQGSLALDPIALPTAQWYIHLKAPLPEAGPDFGIINNNLQGVFPKALKSLSMYMYNLGRLCLGWGWPFM